MPLWKPWLVVAIVAAVAGCGMAEHYPIEGQNDATPMSSVRLEIEDDARNRWDLNYAKTNGRFTQKLELGQTVQMVDGTLFNGPMRLDGAADIDLATLTVSRAYSPDHFLYLLGAGAAFARAQIHLQGRQQEMDGIALGARALFVMRDSDRYPGLRAGAEVYFITTNMGILRYEMLATFRPAAHVQLYAGLQSSNVSFADPYESWSAVYLRYSGPSLGIAISF